LAPPPPPPPAGADGWRWYHAALAFVGGFVATQMAILVIGGVWSLSTGKGFEALSDDPSFVLLASVVNEVLFIAASYFVARMTGPTSLRDFGLSRAPFWSTIWRMAVVMVGYLVLLALYSDLVDLKPDTAPDKLGAGTSNLHMLVFAVLVIVMAPVAEEFFFRGFLYRALRNGLGVVGGVLVSGVLFGALHVDSLAGERLLQVVPLIVLGVSFALLYQWTGTLYSTIALHATNNSIAVVAYASKHDSDFGVVLALATWALMLAVCALGPLLSDRRSAPPVEYSL
jgi:membrane protease YdiL (CAAX protease family)